MAARNDFLVGINEASRILGVSEPALRLWTDEGKLKSFITPGGHRRYSRAELKRFMSLSQKMPGVKDLADKLEDTVPLHREIAINFLQSISWYSKLDKESQQQFADLGRALLHLIIKSFSEPSKQNENIDAIRAIGRQYGEMTRDLGLSLTDSLQAFIRHREPILSAVSEMMKRSEMVNRRVAGSLTVVDHAMDEALISLVSAHQQRETLSG